MYTPGNATTSEEAEIQLRVAQGWLIAKEAGIPKVDSREGLEALGFSILREDELVYVVTPPEGFTKCSGGYWSEVFDATAKKVFTQCQKSEYGAVYSFLIFST